MYKLLVSDFEKVLIDEEDAIPLSTMLELDRIRNNKCIFSVITNKSFKSVLDYNKDFPFIDYIIALDGAYVYDVTKEKPLFKKNIGISIVKKIKRLFDEYNICFYTLDWCNYTKNDVGYEFSRKIGDFKVFGEFHKDNIFKIEIHCQNKKEQTNIINKLDELNLDVNYVPRTGKDYFVEIVMSECSRLMAIIAICKSKKILLRDVLIVGADDDDIELFKKAGYSVSTEDGSAKLKRASHEISSTNEEKIVEEVIKNHM